MVNNIDTIIDILQRIDERLYTISDKITTQNDILEDMYERLHAIHNVINKDSQKKEIKDSNE